MMWAMFVKIITSLRLTVACLSCALVLVFVGTLAQVNLGLQSAQLEYFRSAFITWATISKLWSPLDPSTLQIPIFPGGYLLGSVLLVNLLAAHAQRFVFSWKKAGIFLTHVGLIVLLLGQLLTEVFQVESRVRLDLGETAWYSLTQDENELVFVSRLDDAQDQVISIPESMLMPGREISHPELPFKLAVKKFWLNADIWKPGQGEKPSKAEPTQTTAGAGRDQYIVPLPKAIKEDEANLPAAVVTISGTQSSDGDWLVWSGTETTQEIQHGEGNATTKYQMSLRWKRFYRPYSLTLLNCTHELYKGTDIPKNFASTVELKHAGEEQGREFLIYMNNPLRYDGLTYFQYQMTPGEVGQGVQTVLQVVRNANWWTPYLGCIIVAAGLIYQFMAHLLVFVRKRREA